MAISRRLSTSGEKPPANLDSIPGFLQFGIIVLGRYN